MTQPALDVLKRLNDIGYGLDPQLELDLVVNPEGAFLPTQQSSLRAHKYQSEAHAVRRKETEAQKNKR